MSSRIFAVSGEFYPRSKKGKELGKLTDSISPQSSVILKSDNRYVLLQLAEFTSKLIDNN